MYGLDVAPEYQLYQPHAQRHTTFMNIVARARGDAAALGRPIRDQIRLLEQDEPIFRVATLEQIIGLTLVQRQFALRICGIFAVLALVLAAVGIYGVLSYAMSRRTQEIGIRMALGATRWHVLTLIVSQAALRIFTGIATGIVFALALTSVLRSMLFSVSPRDRWVFLAAAVVLTTVALIASYVPARKVSRADPLSALRHE
jgi:ABC-type antimicrobial peptide transport system permease subunit